MTVAELIAHLQSLPQNLPVVSTDAINEVSLAFINVKVGSIEIVEIDEGDVIYSLAHCGRDAVKNTGTAVRIA